jgi:CheY-like chemotaxis protein
MSKILIVEDEEFLADMYRIKFEAEGFDVLVAANGQIGLDLIKQEKPDLVFLDLVMPVMNGYEALDAIRADLETKNLTVVILSNLGQEEEISEAMKKGADAFLIKANLTPQDLVVKAREILAVGKPVAETKDEEVCETGEGEPVEKNGQTVLLIEDNKELIEMYRCQLENSGYHMELAENGAWGIKMAHERKYDLIVMDMVMPAMNGYDMLKQIKADSQNMETPVIVISNSALEEEIDKALAMGANRYFVKSDITPKKLVEEIADLVASK